MEDATAACYWCGRPAGGRIEIQPARYRKVTKVDPQTGERVSRDEVAEFAIYADVCGEHAQITEDQPVPIDKLRRKRASKAQQTTIYDVPGVGVDPADTRKRSAIYGD